MSATIKSGATTDLVTIDPTSKAMRVTLYNPDGTLVEPRYTYRAATPTIVTPASSNDVFFLLYGSSTKLVKISKITVSGFNITAVQYLVIALEKFSSSATGGTASALVKTPLDSTAPASTLALCSVYTAAPTQGSLEGTIGVKRVLGQATSAAAAGIPATTDFVFGEQSFVSPIILRGAAEGIGLSFGTAPASNVSFSLEVEWTEE